MRTPRVFDPIYYFLLAAPSCIAVGDQPQQPASQKEAQVNVPQTQTPQAPPSQVKPPTNPAKAAPPAKPRTVVLQMADGLRFSPNRFEAKPGEVLTLKLQNDDSSHQPHNIVIVQPGQVQEIVKIALDSVAGGAAPGAPLNHPAIIAATKNVLNPEGKDSLTFTVPSTPGIYGYVCTLPGHGLVMYGALYAGVPMPPLAKDTNIPQATLEKGLVGGGRRPFVQRFFMPNSGPASIAVALPGTQNYCFDTVECRVRYAWSGIFMDGSQYWRGPGKELGELGDSPWWRPNAFPIKFGKKNIANTDLKFLGYTVSPEGPEFHFQAGKQDIFEKVVSDADGILLKFRLPGVKESVVVLTDSEANWQSQEGTTSKNGIAIPAKKAAAFQVAVRPKTPPASAAVTPLPASETQPSPALSTP
jgi:azurin